MREKMISVVLGKALLDHRIFSQLLRYLETFLILMCLLSKG